MSPTATHLSATLAHLAQLGSPGLTWLNLARCNTQKPPPPPKSHRSRRQSLARSPLPVDHP
eukprot:1976509-Prymnesium_polylepis.2